MEFNPPAFQIDYEVGMMEAIHALFPNPIIWGCLFHFGECLFWNVQRFGLSSYFQDNVDFRKDFGRIKVSYLCSVVMLIP